VCGGRKGSDVFFFAKKLQNAPWEVVGGISLGIGGRYVDRGCIDKNIRKNISPKLNFEVWKL
jgi:hypothetical protein